MSQPKKNVACHKYTKLHLTNCLPVQAAVIDFPKINKSIRSLYNVRDFASVIFGLDIKTVTDAM